MKPTLVLPPLSLYIHIPWCVRKCPYCDFNSHTHTSNLPEADYVRCLLQDLANDISFTQGRHLQSIFIGGGTPSLFSAQSIGNLLDGVEAKIPFAEGIEITLEANPGTAERQKFADFRRAGVNRLSIGIQSFDDAQLKRLGRIHDSAQAHKAIDAAHSAGFNNLNLDIMHGLPEQTANSAMADLTLAIAAQPTHLSWYQLTIEPNTVFYRQPPQLPNDDELECIQTEGEERIATAGFKQYEVSAYSRDEKQALHNLNYWQFGDYLAIGAGAHGKITSPGENDIFRFQKKRMPDHYMNSNGSYIATQHSVPQEERSFEFMLNALRLNAGFTAAQFERRTGWNYSDISSVVQQMEERALLLQSHNTISTTALGRRYLNDVVAAFLRHPT